MAIAVVKSILAKAAAATSCTTGAGFDTTAGNLLIANIAAAVSVYSSLTDNNTETWAQSQAGIGTVVVIRERYVANCIGKTGHTFTLTLALSGYPTLVVREVSGAKTSGVLDQTAQNTQSADTAHNTTNITILQDSELLTGAGAIDEASTTTFSVVSPWTEDKNEPHGSFCGIITASQVVWATAAYNFAYTMGSSKMAVQYISSWKSATLPSGSRFNAWGDSLTYGAGPQPPTTAWPIRLANIVQKSIANLGVSSRQTIDIVAAMYALSGTHALMAGGINDTITIGYGTDATKRGYAISSLEAGICWSSLTTKIMAQAATNSGGWTNNTIYGGSVGRYSNTAGDTLTFSGLSGDILYVGYTASETETGTFTVTVDGVLKATINCTGTGITSLSNPPKSAQVYGPQVARITGCGAGAHTAVVITQTNNGHYAYCDWVAGLSNQASFNKVIVANIAYCTAGGYSTFGGSTGNTDAYNTAYAASVAKYAGDGFSVRLAEVNSFVTVASGRQSDGLHWTDTNEAAATAAFLVHFKPGAPTIGTAVASTGSVSVAFSAGTAGIDDSTTGYTAAGVSHTGNTATGSSSPIAITVSNGTADTYTVLATNAIGNSPLSSASNQVTPSGGGTTASGLSFTTGLSIGSGLGGSGLNLGTRGLSI